MQPKKLGELYWDGKDGECWTLLEEYKLDNGETDYIAHLEQKPGGSFIESKWRAEKKRNKKPRKRLNVLKLEESKSETVADWPRRLPIQTDQGEIRKIEWATWQPLDAKKFVLLYTAENDIYWRYGGTSDSLDEMEDAAKRIVKGSLYAFYIVDREEILELYKSNDYFSSFPLNFLS